MMNFYRLLPVSPERAFMQLGEVRQDGLCPVCWVPGLHRLAYATFLRNRPEEMGQSLLYCRDCGWTDV